MLLAVELVAAARAHLCSMSGKRHFPYYSAVPEIELKRPALAAVAPGRERAQPRVFQEGPGFGAVREEVCRCACYNIVFSFFPSVSWLWRLCLATERGCAACRCTSQTLQSGQSRR